MSPRSGRDPDVTRAMLPTPRLQDKILAAPTRPLVPREVKKRGTIER